MKYLVAILFVITLSSCITFNNLTPKYIDDGTSILTDSDKSRIYHFDQYFNTNKQDSVSYKFEYINTDDFKKLSKRSKYSWFIFYAPWCAHSGVLLLRNSNQIKQDLKSIYDLNIYLASQNSDINSMQKMLWSNNKIVAPSYILDPKAFGYDESKKIPTLANNIFGSVEEWSKASPHCIVTDSNMNLVVYKRGDKTNLDTVLKYIKIYEARK
jgi:hypothetical protein